ncbi:MAG TPA: DNA/RNA non-specific endonuclease [Puia sp.]|nr:DNA/RNA non-specific endonuclease [Puia sp.]
MLLPLDQLRRSAQRAPDLRNGKNVSTLPRDFKGKQKTTTPGKGAMISPEENLEKRRALLDTSSAEPANFAFERAIGDNDAVYSNFVELIAAAKSKVGKVVVKTGARATAFATGFLVSSDLLLTNWHVFNAKADVADSEVEFFYEYDISGEPMPVITFRLEADRFFYSSQGLDYCLVAVSPQDITGTHKLTELGYLFLDPSIGKIGNENEEKLNIIHHPDGDYKQLSIRENLFVKITDTTIWYQTDTAQGSSGSPVFNDQWQVVALHHMGIAKTNDKGEYVDKNGMAIPVTNGQVDESRLVWIANEGIRISVLLSDVLSKYPNNPLVTAIKKPPTGPSVHTPEPSPESSTVMPVTNNNAGESSGSPDDIKISLPSALLRENGSLTIRISGDKEQNKPAASTAEDEIAEENKKLEDSTDYSACNGYQADFLGTGKKSVALPKPGEKIKKFVAKVTGGATVLNYYNYSTIFHSVRMMPMISCINVAGDPGERKDKQKRKDNWLRDSRLSFDIQLDDPWYSNSGFDKGHMSRREDADWGDNAADALRNANLTCMYTNACPQVPKINRSSSGKDLGLWGKLEQIVLEKGLEKEPGKTSKASVFNGPVFQNDDPVYKAIQVPMDFFKIVIWLTDAGKLKATAFRLSQTKLVSTINFEEIDVDKNTAFKPFQVSIKKLAQDTGFDFSALESIDTFEGDQNKLTAITEESVKKHVKKQNGK